MRNRIPTLLLSIAIFGLSSHGEAQDRFSDSLAVQPPTFNDVAQFVAGFPVRPQSSLYNLTTQPAVARHRTEARNLSDTWENSRLKQMREWVKAEIHPKISRPQILKYMFGGPDFVHAATLFPGVPEYILVGLEPLGSLPDFPRMTPVELDSYLGQLNYSLRSISRRNFFITTEMREDFGKQGVDGVFPVLLYFAALTNHDVIDATYVKLKNNGSVAEAAPGAADGIRMRVRLRQASPNAPSELVVHYFKTDLSNSGFQAGSSFHKFLSSRPGGVAYLKAASYLMHTDSFSNIRNYLVGDCPYVLQDESGIPHAFLRQYYNLEYYGNYVGPIDMFREYEQADLFAVYRSGVAKKLPFGTGYRMKDGDSVQIFGVRK